MEKGALTHNEEEGIEQQLVSLYGFVKPIVGPMQVSSENALYRVDSEDGSWVLKLFKVSGNFSRSRVAEHTHYEAKLVQELTERNFATAAIYPKVDGELVSSIEDYPALLFKQLTGDVIHHTNGSLDQAVAALARFHTTQLEQPLCVDTEFHFDDACMIWLPLFHGYRFDTTIDTEISSVLNRFAPLVEELNAGERREVLFSRSPSLHCHGDVSPRNIILDNKGEVWLFDFNHAIYGPRLMDVIDGAFQFSLADFTHFDTFLDHYFRAVPLSAEEHEDLSDWIALVGIIRLAKTVRVLLDPRMQSRHARYFERLHYISSILSRLVLDF